MTPIGTDDNHLLYITTDIHRVCEKPYENYCFSNASE